MDHRLDVVEQALGDRVCRAQIVSSHSPTSLRKPTVGY
jgi:hypothetical protein